MAAISTTTMISSLPMVASLLGQIRETYWSGLSDTERSGSIGPVTKLLFRGQSVWDVAGCLLKYWKDKAFVEIMNMCSHEKNHARIYRGRHERIPFVFGLYLLGPFEDPVAAKPCVFIFCGNDTISSRVISLLKRRRAVLEFGFQFQAYEDELKFTTRSAHPMAASTNTFAKQSLCGMRILTIREPIADHTMRSQCTVGGVITMGQRWYGLTVAHPFLQHITVTPSDDGDVSPGSDLSDTSETDVADSNEDPQEDLGEEQRQIQLSNECPLYGVYLEELNIPKTSCFSRPGPEDNLTPISHFHGKTIDSESVSATSERLLSPWSLGLDWALVEVSERRFHVPNVIRTPSKIVTPAMYQPRHSFSAGKAFVAAGVSGVIETWVQPGVVGIALPWSAIVQEAWVIEHVCKPGDSGAWVVCPETGLIYGMVVAVSSSMQLTYILPAETIFESILNRSSNSNMTLRDLFPLPGVTQAVTESVVVQKALSKHKWQGQPPRSDSGLGSSGPGSRFQIGTDYSTQNLTQSCLSPLAQHFAQIKIHEFAECKKFIEHRPVILKEDKDQFQREAAIAYQRGNTQYARACIHRGLLIRKCSRMDRDECERFLRNLTGGKESTVRDFIDDLDDSYDALKSRAERIASEIVDSAEVIAIGYDTRTEGYGATHGQDSTYTESGTDPITSLESFSAIRLGSASAYSKPLNSDTVTDGARSYRPPPRSSSRDSISSEIEIRGTEGDAEYLDRRYRRQRDPGGFFVVGKVFALLWHENVGRSKKQPGSDVKFVQTVQTDNSTVGRFGERIFSHVRRMIVVRRRYGYCWCVAINTYGGRGVAGKRRANAEDQLTIVYDSSKKPEYVAGETTIIKEPIAVVMSPPETLHRASRINYAKVHTVEHDVKVLNVGMVHPDSMPYFESHWQNEFSRE